MDCTLCPVQLHNLKPCCLLSDVLVSFGPTDTADSELGSFYCARKIGYLFLLSYCYLLLLFLLQYLLFVKSCGIMEIISTTSILCYSLLLLSNVSAQVNARIFLLLNRI